MGLLTFHTMLHTFHTMFHTFYFSQDPDFDFDKNKKKNLSKSSHFEDKNRRRGRPASKRSPDDSPLRDANRDYLYGILTIRAIRTLIVYLQETNLNLSHWLAQYLMQNPITLSGSWKDISGDAWLENLIRLPTQVSKYDVGKETLYDNAASIGVDPKDVCTRILEIRKTLAKEFIEDLTDVSEANADILRASLMTSLEASFKLDSSSEEE